VVFEVKYSKYTLFVYILLPHRSPPAVRKQTLEFSATSRRFLQPAKQKMLTGDGGNELCGLFLQVTRSFK
jgi:hypothetical protein